MNKRVGAALAAVLLAITGVFMLVNYASAADERAYDGATLQTVLQVSAPISADTPAAELTSKVKTVKLPKSAIAKGAATTLKDIKGLVATTNLEPGEQVLLTRFAKSGSLPASKVKSVVPKGMQELTIPLETPRAVGGTFKAGDRVGVLVGYTPKEGEPFTKLILNKVLITRVTDDAVIGGGDQAATTQMITLAVAGGNAIRIVNAAEFGKVWLTKQNDDVATPKTGTISLGAVKK